MSGAVPGAAARGVPGRALLAIALVALAGPLSELRAQNLISVPFTNGVIGTRGSSAGTANNVLTFATLGIARIFFLQNSSTNSFELQGNDIPGTMRIVRADGTTLDMPASANWRNSGGTTYLIGILPRPTSAVTLAYAGGSIQITDGSASGGSSIGGYVAAYSGTMLADGASTSGNAAASQVLDGLNSYLATVVASRPAGPVTVTALSTSATTPTIAGTATLAAGENLSVVVGGVQYTPTSTPAVARSGTAWSLALTSPLAVGTYSVTATITNADGFTLSDATADELVIASAAGGTVTLSGSFTAADREYDGTTAATGTTSGLTLAGVTAPDDVSIAAVALGFQTAAVGSGKTVMVTAVTLGGADAGRYGVSLAGAPTATASITARMLTISGVSATDREYDGTTTAALTGTASYDGLAGCESFAVTGTPAASFATAAVDTGKAVTVTGYTPPTANYDVTQPAGLTASVTAKPLTIDGSFVAADRPFDGSSAATITTNALTLAGRVGADEVFLTGVTATFADPAAGADKPVTLATATLAGAAAANYTLVMAGAPETTASIVVAPPASTPPSPPRDAVGTPGDASVAVSWMAPETQGCGAVGGYLVDYSADGGRNWTRVTLTAPSPTAVVLRGLTNNVAYLVRVAAVNPCGPGAFAAAIGPVVPSTPDPDGTGHPATSAPGTASSTTDGVPRPVTTEVVQDTILRLAGADFTLRLTAVDQPGVAIPIDSSGTLRLEQGSVATVDGSGFAPGTFVSLYLLAATGGPLPLGTVAVGPDATFAAARPIPAGLPAGMYTLQVGGIDLTSSTRSVALGVEVAPPPPDLVLTATPDQQSPTVGDTITITLTVTNRGRGPAIDVVIPRAFAEPGFTIVGTEPLEGSYDAPAQEWTIGHIEPGGRARMRIAAVVLPPADPQGSDQGSNP